MFVKANLLRRLRYKFEERAAGTRSSSEVFDVDTTLGSEKLRTLLLLVMRNATTDSPWPISNNPYAKYNDERTPRLQPQIPALAARSRQHRRADLLPAGSNRAAEHQAAREREFIFVDGGVTMYNNPAFQMFLMATLDRYWALKPEARWRTGADRMLIVSVGTGTSPDARSGLEPDQMNLLFNATTIPVRLDVRRIERAGSALPGIRRLPRRRNTRPRGRRPRRQRWPVSSASKSSSPTCATMPS